MSGDDTPETIADGQGEAAAEAQPAAQQTAGSALSANKNYIQQQVAAFAVVGIGIGLAVFLIGEFGSYPFELTGSGIESGDVEPADRHASTVESLATQMLYMVPLLVLALATFVGVRARNQFSDDQTALVVSSVGTAAGTIVFVVLSGILLSTQFPEVGEDPYAEIAGIDYAGLITNGIVLAIAAAIVAGGVAYAASRFE